MKKAGIFFPEGMEECEALLVVDILRRAKVQVTTISITDEKMVKSSHGIVLMSDEIFEQVDFSDFDMLVLPGGIPGTPNLEAHSGVCNQLKEFFEEGKYIGAVCAAPSILAKLGMLYEKKGTSHPSRKDMLIDGGAVYSDNPVEKDGTIITSRGLGTGLDFAFALVEVLEGKTVADDIKKAIVYIP